MMLAHTWLEQYRQTHPRIADTYSALMLGAVQFDCGPVDDIPIGKGREFCEARAPFPSTLLQFETPSSAGASHAMALWREQDDGSVFLIAAQKQGQAWLTCAETRVTRNYDGSFHYERWGHEERNTDFVMLMHARAMNLFYILGCSNVETADNPAPAALNKKRAKAGKLPILEYKTLVLKIDTQRPAGSEGGGTHASPRVHLRRGHIRRIESGRRVWVQPCVVGSTHGMVLKDYKVATTAAKASNGEVRGASRLAGEASSAEGATSTVVLGNGGNDGQ